jgi:putative tricarboxylic transport membrane protein
MITTKLTLADFQRRSTAPLTCLAILLLTGLVPSVHAQQGSWRPERAVEIVVPTTSGGSIDTTARALQRVLQNNKILEMPVLIVNKPGGAGAIAVSYLDLHPGDAHYLLTSTISLLTNHIQGRSKVTYTDYTPIANILSEYMTMVVRPESPIRSARDIQNRLKTNPQALSIAVGNALGGSNHLQVSLLMKSMGVDPKQLKTVIFPSNAQALPALMGGHVDLMSMTLASALSAAQQGRLRIIGISSEKRGDGPLAEIPTWKEQGFDVQFSNTRFIVGPKNITPAQLAYWDGALEKAVQTPEWKAMIDQNEAVADFTPSKQTAQRLADLYKVLRGALVDAGLAR